MRSVRQEIVNEEEEEEVITIEVPWDTIKLRFHLFFIGSISILLAYFVYNVSLHFIQSQNPQKVYSIET